MKTLAIAYAATLVAFLAIDALWLTRMAPTFYRPIMGDMALEDFRPAPAIVFYLLFIAALVFFAVKPGLSTSLPSTMIHAAFFGLVAYGTYDLTNHATLKNWSTALTVVDMGWGAILSAAAAGIGRTITLWLAPPV